MIEATSEVKYKEEIPISHGGHMIFEAYKLLKP